MTNRWHREGVRTRGVWLLALLVACTPEPSGVPEDHGGLAAGSYQEREIAAGEAHVYRWNLEPERFIRGAVIEVDADLVVTAHGPDGRVLARADGPAGAGMDETFAFTTGGAGEYRLEIRPKGEAGGRYDLDLVELRPARRGDEERVAAWRAFQAARHQWALRPYEDPVVEASFRDVLALFEAVGDRSGEAAALQQIGWLQPTPAGELEYYEEALERLDGGGEPGLRGGILADAATALGEQGEPERAVERYWQVVELWESLPGRTGDLAKTLSSLGLTLEDLSRHGKAREILERALTLWQQQGEQGDGLVRTLVGLGLVENQLGHSFAALEHLDMARQRALAAGNLRQAALALIFMAAPYQHLGDLQAALGRLRQAEEELLEIGLEEQDERRLQQVWAQVWLQLGDPVRGEELAERAVALAREDGGRPHVLAGALLTLAEAKLALGETEEAHGLFEKAMEESRLSSQPSLIAHARLGTARALRLAGRLDKARAELIELRREAEQSGRFDSRLLGSIELAEVELARRDLAAAERAVAEVSELVPALAPPAARADDHAIRARLDRALGRPREALKEIRKAVALYEEIRGRVDSSELRALVLARRLASYDLETDLLLDLGQHEEALESAERSRARSLVELLEWAQEDTDTGTDRRLKARDLYNRLNRRLVEALGEGLDGAQLERLEENLRRAQDELDRLELERRTTPLVAGSFDLSHLQRDLRDGEVLLEYHLGAERATLFVVTRDELSVHRLGATRELEERVDRFLEQLRTPSRRERKLALDGHRLYEDLIDPAEPQLTRKGVQHLVIVPDGNLVYLPWEVLRTNDEPEDAEGYLLSRWAVSYAPSARVWGKLAEQRDSTPHDDAGALELVAFAYPAGGPGEGELLEWVGEEVADVAALYPEAARLVYADAAATEAEFLDNKELRRARVIHVASHGEIDERRPVFSGLRLAPSPGGGDDGLVQVHEIFGLGELSAELVVLSACHTGLGRQIRGEGLVGLSRAFFSAGTPLLTASLWKVADRSTARLMTDFHHRMRRGDSPVEALRRAKLALAADPAFRHPYYWAPFVMIGHAESPTAPSEEEP